MARRSSGKEDVSCDALKPMIGTPLLTKHSCSLERHLEMATSIKQGTVAASRMIRKLGSYPLQKGLTMALREFGRIEKLVHSGLAKERRTVPAYKPDAHVAWRGAQIHVCAGADRHARQRWIMAVGATRRAGCAAPAPAPPSRALFLTSAHKFLGRFSLFVVLSLVSDRNEKPRDFRAREH
jgi:hypothetical protein